MAIKKVEHDKGYSWEMTTKVDGKVVRRRSVQRRRPRTRTPPSGSPRARGPSCRPPTAVRRWTSTQQCSWPATGPAIHPGLVRDELPQPHLAGAGQLSPRRHWEPAAAGRAARADRRNSLPGGPPPLQGHRLGLTGRGATLLQLRNGNLRTVKRKESSPLGNAVFDTLNLILGNV